MTFLVNLDPKSYADGSIYVDDGISVDSVSSGKYAQWKVRMAPQSINFLIEHGDSQYSPAG